VARLGLQLDPVGRFATFVWPPTGLSLAALLLFGRNLWPGIFLGAAVVNVWTGAPPLVAAGIALGNTLEAVLGEYALSKIPGFRLSLDRLVDGLGLVGVALTSTVVSATIGVASLYAGGIITGAHFGETWSAWWQGDVLGDLVVAPFLLTWASARWHKASGRRAAEAAALAAVLIGASLVLLGGDASGKSALSAFQQPTTLLPVLIWVTLRFGTQGASAATLVVSTVAVWTTALGRGPFIRSELHESLAVLQAFMSVVAVTGLVLAAVTSERLRVVRERRELIHRERVVRAYAEEMQRQRRGEGTAPGDSIQT
jgi:integral membrane sensor domain MASE1